MREAAQKAKAALPAPVELNASRNFKSAFLQRSFPNHGFKFRGSIRRQCQSCRAGSLDTIGSAQIEFQARIGSGK